MIMISGRLMMPKLSSQSFDSCRFIPSGRGGGGRARAESSHRLSVLGGFHPAVRHRQGKRVLSAAGLDVEYIQMRTAIAPQAILNGNINFFTSPQSGYRRCFRLPLVVVLVLYKDTPWVLVTSKEINQTQDLIGKKIAISDLRSSPYYFSGPA